MRDNGYYAAAALLQKHPQLALAGWTKQHLERLRADCLIDAYPQPGTDQFLYGEKSVLRFFGGTQQP
ncbi:MAG: hypothetical protein AAF998_23330 [Bacteroidota bacterium]